MKKLLILLAVLLTANVMTAQKKDRTDAFMYNRNGQYEKAIQSIEKCVNHEQFLGMKPKDQATAWLYRATIYQNVLQSTDPEVRALAPDALEKAYESLLNISKADPSFAKDNAQDVYPRIASIQNRYYTEGADNYNTANYAVAANAFKKAYDISLSLNAVDTTSLIYAANACMKQHNYEQALAYLTDLKNIGYDKVDLYKDLAATYNGLGDEAKAYEMIILGLQKYPGDASMIIEKVNVYLKQGKGEEAINDLKKLNELDPNNASILFTIGTLYGEEGHGRIIGSSESEVRDAFGEPKDVDKTATEQGNSYWWIYEDGKKVHFDNEGKVDMARNCPDYLKVSEIYDPDKAIQYYEEAINVNPQYYDAVYNLGAMYISLSNKLKAQANDLPIEKQKEYEELVKQAEDLVRTGLPYVKQAYDAQPTPEVKQVLKTMYVQLKMNDEAKALDNE